MWRATPRLLLCKADGAALHQAARRLVEAGRGGDSGGRGGGGGGGASVNSLLAVTCRCEQEASDLLAACEHAAGGAASGSGSGSAASRGAEGPASTSGRGGSGGSGGQAAGGANAFDAKIDKTSSDMYFHYYGMLQHQQNMLQVGGSG